METKELKKIQNSKIEKLALQIETHRTNSGGKRVRFPDEIRKAVSDLVASGIKPHQISKATGLSHGGIMTWAKRFSKFKSLKVVNSRKPKVEAAVVVVPNLTVRLTSGAEVKMNTKLFLELMEKGIL